MISTSDRNDDAVIKINYKCINGTKQAHTVFRCICDAPNMSKFDLWYYHYNAEKCIFIYLCFLYLVLNIDALLSVISKRLSSGEFTCICWCI